MTPKSTKSTKPARAKEADKNRRLDSFLQQLQIQQEKRQQIVDYVQNMEKLASDILQQKTTPKLRLVREGVGVKR